MSGRVDRPPPAAPAPVGAVPTPRPRRGRDDPAEHTPYFHRLRLFLPIAQVGRHLDAYVCSFRSIDRLAGDRTLRDVLAVQFTKSDPNTREGPLCPPPAGPAPGCSPGGRRPPRDRPPAGSRSIAVHPLPGVGPVPVAVGACAGLPYMQRPPQRRR